MPPIDPQGNDVSGAPPQGPIREIRNDDGTTPRRSDTLILPSNLVASYDATEKAIRIAAGADAVSVADIEGMASSAYNSIEVLTLGRQYRRQATGGSGAWNGATAYVTGNLVYYAGKGWRAIDNSTNQEPSAPGSLYWKIDMDRISATTGTAIWVDVQYASPTWWGKPFWTIDPSGGDDENLGWGANAAQSDSRPLRTMAEVIRRLRGSEISSLTLIRLLGDINEDVWIGGINSPQGGQDVGVENAFIAIVGVPTVIHSGTLTAVQAQAGNNRGYLEDTSIPTSWAESGLVSGSSTPRLIQSTSTNRKAWVLKDLGSKRCQIDTPTLISWSVQQQIGAARSDFEAGESYEILTFPKIHGLRIAPGLRLRAYGVHVYAPLGGQIISWAQGGPTFVLSWLENVTVIGNGCGLFKSGTAGTTSFSGASVYWVSSTAFGDDIGDHTWLYHSTLTSSGLNVVYGTRLRADFSIIIENLEQATVNWAVWDCLIRALNLSNRTFARFDTLVGDGNADYVIYSDYPAGLSLGTSTNFLTAWTCLSDAAKPISMGPSGTFDYDELPAHSAELGWSMWEA